jgi:hypothetical protein
MRVVIVVVAVLMLGIVSAAWADQAKPAVKVEKADVAVEYKRFDPQNLPDPPPPLKPGEAAVCVYHFGVEVDSQYSYTEPGGTGQAAPNGQPVKLEVKVEEVSVRLSLGVTIWLPKGADNGLTAHEEGHRRIAEHYYASADALANGLATKLVGQKVIGEAKDLHAAGRAAVDRVNQKLCADYLAAVNQPCERAQGAFDRLTDHSRNERPTAEQAVGLAIKEAAAKK